MAPGRAQLLIDRSASHKVSGQTSADILCLKIANLGAQGVVKDDSQQGRAHRLNVAAGWTSAVAVLLDTPRWVFLGALASPPQGFQEWVPQEEDAADCHFCDWLPIL